MRGDRWLWAILLLGATVRLAGLGERSLSYDECQQFWASQGNVLISNREITLDPPGFAYLLHLHALAGRGETWLRLLPCLCGILGIVAVHRLALSATGSRFAAGTAAFFIAVAPYPIRYSQSLRVYSLAMLCTAALVAVFLEAAEDGNRGRWGRPLLLVLLTFATLLSVYGGVWIVLLLAILLGWRGLRRKERAPWRALAGLVAGAALALPIYLLSLPVQLTQGTPAGFYDDKFMPLSPLPAVRFLIRGTFDLFAFFSYIHLGAGLLFGALAVLGMVRVVRIRREADLPVLFLGGLALAAAASALRLYPYGGTRQMLFAAPLFYVLGAAGIESLRHRFRGAPAIAVLIAMTAGCGIFLYRYHTEPGGQEMRPVIRSLEQAARPGDRILVNKDALPQFRFYYHGDPGRVVEGRESVVGDYLPEVNRVMTTALRSRWWLVFSHGWDAERRRELEAVDPRFTAGQRIEAHRAAAYLFEPRTSDPAAPGDGEGP